ncbi:type I-E CRISPR-associated protein Cse2/CasB [Nocardiopsis sp. NPDC049922]|uniref:type I-E CRISPR-associated protein Cse2/CasB n=1 Tax=Nocardiopsis sp. NPDC049922 TaxID=3155157 RepID=UPI0033F3D0BB
MTAGRTTYVNPIGPAEAGRLHRILDGLWPRPGEMASDTPARLSRWRRGLSLAHDETPELSMEVAQVFQGGDPSWNAQEAVFQALALYAAHQQSVRVSMHSDAREEHRFGTSVGHALRELCVRAAPKHPRPWEDRDNAGVVRLTEAVLTSHSMPELVGHLRRTVPLLRGEAIPLDYTRLARDVHDWSTRARGRAADRWAMDFHEPVPHAADADDSHTDDEEY